MNTGNRTVKTSDVHYIYATASINFLLQQCVSTDVISKNPAFSKMLRRIQTTFALLSVLQKILKVVKDQQNLCSLRFGATRVYLLKILHRICLYKREIPLVHTILVILG